jgi:hypothetical protein
MRYAGVSLGSQVTSIFAGSLAPLLATQWLKDTGSWLPTAIYLVVACVITTVAVLTLKETKGIALEDVDRADAEREGLVPAAANCAVLSACVLSWVGSGRLLPPLEPAAS